jgi:adenosylcobinamide kinase / adenosylcobinamide-phosphate guanylyltransferase
VSTGAANLTLLLGGARSGKSATAERLALASGAPVLYVATAQIGDEEMAERVARHVARRPVEWRTLEAPLNLAAALCNTARADETVLIDSIDVWLSNALLAALGNLDAAAIPRALAREIEARVLSEVADLCAWATARTATVLLVSSEVGSGVVPPYPLGRVFRDLLGSVNQALATAAGDVLLVIAGIPVDLHRLERRI